MRSKGLVIGALIVLIAVSQQAFGAVIRVKWDSATNGPGSSWGNAYRSVGTALSASSSGDEVWVARGTYIGSVSLKSGMGLYGGFVGTETLRDQRNWKANVTILDGNQQNVVYASWLGSGATSVLDGFTITNGDNGISCSSSSPTIKNNTMTHNNTGVSCWYSSNPLITGNTVRANNSGIGCMDGSNPVITGNAISDNTTGIKCGSTSPSIICNVMSANATGIDCVASSPTIANNTIFGSITGIECDGSSPSISNNIVAFNGIGIRRLNGGSPVLKSNCVHNPQGISYDALTAGVGDISADPQFVWTTYGQLHIEEDSPCVNAGLDSAAPGGLDIDGQPRLQGSHVDIGADESDGTVWPEFQPVVARVSPSGADDTAHDGSSWALAKRTVQAGMDAVSAAGGEVWIAAGTYAEHVTLSPYVYVYGGFAGTESTRDVRDWAANRSVLDGSGTGDVITARNCHRLSALDGLTVRGGRSGIRCDWSSPTIANCTITGNSSCGICCNGSSPAIDGCSITGSPVGIECGYSSSPSIAGNTISGSTSFGISCGDNCSPIITGNVISRNPGCGIYSRGAAPTITSNTLSANVGGGIGCEGSCSAMIANNTITAGKYWAITCSSSSPTIINNTIAGYAYGGIRCISSSPVISNNIVAYNALGIRTINGGTPVLKSNCVYNPGVIDYDGLAPGAGDISEDPRLASAEYGRMHIQQDSPCVDKGLDSAVLPGWLDMEGQARVQGAHVDIGADESDGTMWSDQPVIVRVSPIGVDNAAHDGSSWALAKRTVQAGIDAASSTGGEVWIAAGTYAEHVTLHPYAYLYGGFAGVECGRNERNWVVNRSILDGGGSGNVVDLTSLHLPYVLDGLTIRNGTTGIHCQPCASATIRNCTVSGNSQHGIYCLGASTTAVANCTISGNGGSGIDCMGASPTITGNVISANGTGIHCDSYDGSCSPRIANNTISGNAAGIACIYSSSVSITNNILAFNGTGIFSYNSEASTMRSNCVYNPGGTNYSGLVAGTGDFSEDPLFVARLTGDYHLLTTSPCIDKGLSSAVPPGSVDMDGDPRILPTAGIVDIGADEFPFYAIAEAKATVPDGRSVCLDQRNPMVTTARLANQQAYYVECLDRTSGIRCSGVSLLEIGQKGVLQGVMGTVDGERVLTQASVVSGTLGTAQVPGPLFVIGRSVGGGTGGLQQGIADGCGLNNIGLLVRTSGRIVGAESSSITIDDGGGVDVKCAIPSGVEIDPAWQYVSVTGVSSCEKIGDAITRLIRVRGQADVVGY